jgi:phage shock protein A
MDAETVDEIKRHVSVVAEDLRSDVRAVAEAVSAHREEFRREIVGVRTELDEVKGMIRLSYAEIDRRVRTLEGELQDLRARVERLEERRVS